MKNPYTKAQQAIASLKSAVYDLLSEQKEPMTNVQIGKSLGIYMGHVEHEGHISRTILALMEKEGVVEQSKTTKAWSLKSY